ncbi:MAG: putative lipid II flippase FtsW [Deltaproteobacteria bacterium]|nr:putative lipid II flippase FtsW [Deltaproteobacteria bacterium]
MLTRAGAPQLIVAASFLVATGLVMVFSASAMRAELFFGNSGFFVLRQAGGLILGLAVAATLARMPQAWLQRGAYPAWAFASLLVFASLTPLGLSVNGAHRWVSFGGFNFQPLELAKLGLVLALAQWLSTNRKKLRDARISIVVPMLLTCIPAAGLLAQPDFGGALLLVLFAGVIIFASGARLDHLAVAAGIGAPLVIGIALSAGYRIDRLRAFVDPFSEQFGAGFQLVQSLVAFGAGGLSGTGLGSGQQKLGYLPEAHTDFVLSVVGEEIGLLGVAAVLALFATLAVASLGIASRARSPFGAVLALGASLLIWLQGLVNAGVALGVLPTTGATLPLFSYGRTSLVVSLAALGLVLNAARPQRRGRAGWRS